MHLLFIIIPIPILYCSPLPGLAIMLGAAHKVTSRGSQVHLSGRYEVDIRTSGWIRQSAAGM